MRQALGSCGWNTAAAARIAAGARISVAWPPQAATAARTMAAPASSNGGSAAQMRPPAQSYMHVGAASTSMRRASSAPFAGAVEMRQTE